MIPGEYILSDEPIEANKNRESISLIVKNTGDRPVQVGSHFHFFEANKALVFERDKAFGMRLNIPAGTAVRFEPGQDKMVMLVVLGGKRKVFGLNGLTDGKIDDAKNKNAAFKKARQKGFGGI